MAAEKRKVWQMLQRLGAWLALSRPPFHSVGVLPFVLGTVLAWRQEGAFRWDVCAWGILGVVLIMLATYYAGEYWDFAEDTLSSHAGASRFAGGSQVLQRGLLPRHAALRASLLSLLLALGVGWILQWVYHTGPWTLPLGALGMLGGFFYSSRPVRWVGRGWGELWIGFCYGWLPVAVGYYLQTSKIAPVIHWLALPIGLTIFDVILLNEFPDYAADREAGKANLTVRLGRERAAWLYALTSLLSWLAMWLSLQHGVPSPAAWLYLPVMLLSVVVVALVLNGRWRNRDALERLCAANLVVNLGTTAAYILTFVTATASRVLGGIGPPSP
jgi:1,4-dihydroxy-2-naphthoate octaprenyltransferase